MYGSFVVSSRHAACASQPAAPAKINMINNVINGFYQVTSCDGVDMNRRRNFTITLRTWYPT